MQGDLIGGLKPMLAKPAGMSTNFYFDAPGWGAQLKMDGQRAMVKVIAESVGSYRFRMESRAGKQIENFNPELPRIFRGLSQAEQPMGVFVDGELMPDGTFWAFDIVMTPDPVALNRSYVDRHRTLRIFEALGPDQNVLRVNPLYTKPDEKRALWATAVENNLEGVVFKKLSSSYQSGTRSDDWVKAKLTKDVDCVITNQNLEGKSNFEMSMCDPQNNRWITVGTVSALTGDGPSIKVGDVVKVTCLYASDDNKLVQPVTPMLRDDKKPLECTVDQLDSIRPNRNYNEIFTLT